MKFIYNDLINVTVNSKQSEKKQCYFRVTVDVENLVHGNAYNFKITDDGDPTFLYSLLLGEDDFLVLKAQQGLRVDFENFPTQLAKLLSDCKTRENQFRLVLDDTDVDDTKLKGPPGCYIKVIESNDFKYLCHLSLRIAPGSVEDVRKHLCNKLYAVQDQLAYELNEKNRLIEQNESYVKEIKNKEKKVTELECRVGEEANSVRLELNQRLSAQREKAETERIELETQHQQAIKELQNEVALLTHKNTILLEAKRDTESSLRVITLKNETAEKDISRMSATIAELKVSVSNLEQKNVGLEQHLSGTQRRLAAAETARQDMSVALNQALRDLQSVRERDSVLTANLTQCERRLAHTTSQLGHATKSIVGLETELNAKRKKMAHLLTVVDILEKDLKNTREELETKSKLLADLEINEKDRKKELEIVKNQLSELETQVKEQEHELKKQRDVNICLHRKLNEKDINLQSRNASVPELFGSHRINSSTQFTSKTLPPWLTGDSLDESSTNKNAESKKEGLDPSYLIPEENDQITKKLERVKSAYFPAKSFS